MSKWTSMSVKDTTLERFNELKEEVDQTEGTSIPPCSADLFLNALMDEWENEGPNANDINGGASDISEALEALRRDVDELQHELPRKVAEELR